ncbi:hypothetical protein QIG73_27160, partial [Klebsiella pneumoniae]|nr:hypothetical protein [Klebsiella pneumoniae]
VSYGMVATIQIFQSSSKALTPLAGKLVFILFDIFGTKDSIVSSLTWLSSEINLLYVLIIHS